MLILCFIKNKLLNTQVSMKKPCLNVIGWSLIKQVQLKGDNNEDQGHDIALCSFLILQIILANCNYVLGLHV